MHKFRRRIKRYYENVIHSIGFIPTIIAVGFAFSLMGFLALDDSGTGKSLRSAIPLLDIGSTQTAHAILTTVVGGIISLTVLSFSMVMVVLGQATSNYSPKLLRGLVSDKSHQVVLGAYLGTTIYCLLLLLTVRKESLLGYVPGLSIFMALTYGIICLILFVFFIHNTSESIQITNIINKIYKSTKRELAKKKKSQKQESGIRSSQIKSSDYQWYGFPARESGYFQEFNQAQLLKFATDGNFIIRIEAKPGTYILKKSTLFSTNKPLSEEHDLPQRVGSYFSFYNDELISVNPFYGYRQLMEVAVKALSPGINDPGTAINCIHHLSDLLSMHMQAGDENIVVDNKGRVRLIIYSYSFSDLMDMCFNQIRLYGKRDLSILGQLLKMLDMLSLYDEDNMYKTTLEKHAQSLREDADQELKNSHDRDFFNNLIRSLISEGYYTLTPLKTYATGRVSSS